MSFTDIGPLAGIARALKIALEPLLLVLAVDMPDMSDEFIKRLHACCQDGIGAVPVCDKIIEPLAAFYPKVADKLLPKPAAEPKPAHPPGAKHFAEACVQAGLARFIPVAPVEAAIFKSWNSPADLPQY